MKNFKIYYINILFLCFAFSLFAQDTSLEYIETEAVIKEVNFKVRSRRSSATAKVAYKTIEGDSLTSIVKLMHIPFIGALDKEGDRIKILYNKETPLLLTTKSTSFWQSYGLYFLVGLGIIILLYRFLNRSKK
ncbi:hypothetical protein D1818_24300 [Aquimarina sp. BL5]|uniref:DUF3592 domain-containing protein n=1 Tax=Aquimarina sp. BL5 TaxID=1714860 RepID=UPI000E4A343C|nr:DUF3592 domain-containing protein [Aquimarina sp. BL5]AXT53788.1 hypothetical protein D1818_24300 [Aquimarina sp. BL5]RKN00536.1 hypothetical protein D7036_18515 [Aquimarina sp. BL5]